MSMLWLTLELSGLQMRRTPVVVVEATGPCASLLTGLLPPAARGALCVLEAFGVAEKLPLQGAEEMTKSSECVRALVA